jgi:NurA-like 5'-3' nuclease
MLFELYESALKRRDEIIRMIKGNTDKIREAEDRWNEYEPKYKESRLVGVDSSFNYKSYKGFYLYALAGVAVTSDDRYYKEPIARLDFEKPKGNGNGISIRNLLLLRCMDVEYELIKDNRDSIGIGIDIDNILIDGSILARLYDRRFMRDRGKEIFLKYKSILRDDSRVIFVAKNSDSNTILGGNLADIYYFSRASTKAGYVYEYGSLDGEDITVAYVRLKPCTPVIKLEISGKKDDDEMKYIMDRLATESVSGYPYVLRLAHERCKIRDEDMDRIEDIFGLGIEEGSREVLEE